MHAVVGISDDVGWAELVTVGLADGAPEALDRRSVVERLRRLERASTLVVALDVEALRGLAGNLALVIEEVVRRSASPPACEASLGAAAAVAREGGPGRSPGGG